IRLLCLDNLPLHYQYLLCILCGSYSSAWLDSISSHEHSGSSQHFFSPATFVLQFEHSLLLDCRFLFGDSQLKLVLLFRLCTTFRASVSSFRPLIHRFSGITLSLCTFFSGSFRQILCSALRIRLSTADVYMNSFFNPGTSNTSSSK